MKKTFEGTVLKQFPVIPKVDLLHILEHTLKKKSRRVGRNRAMRLEEKMRLAATGFVALKIANSPPAFYRAAQTEIDIASRISSMWPTHQGEEYIGKALDSVEADGPG